MARTRLGRTLPETVGVHGAIEHSAPAITFDRVNVAYGRGKTATHALVDFNLRVAPGETVALLGPSGSGKSTALKALAGFVRPTSGSVKLGTRDITNLPPAQRGIGVVVQSYALFPHMRVSENVAFGLRAHRVPRSEIGPRVAEALDMVGMSAYGKRLPRELSGGQQQRIAIARALAIRPGVLLLDEPLAALDAQLRESMLGELARLRAALPDTAMLYVTHDQSEALALADRIAVMRNARLADIDTAESLWKRPPSSFTAAFLGGANLLPCTVTRVIGTSALVSIGGTPFTAHAPAARDRAHRMGVRHGRLPVCSSTRGSRNRCRRTRIIPGAHRLERLARFHDASDAGCTWPRRRPRRRGCSRARRTTGRHRSGRRPAHGRQCPGSGGSPPMTTTLERPETAAPQHKDPIPWRRIGWTLPPLLLVLVFAVYPTARVLTESLSTADGTGCPRGLRCSVRNCSEPRSGGPSKSPWRRPWVA